MSHRTSFLNRFWTKVDQSGGIDACWNWTASGAAGYGRLKDRDGKGLVLAHRVAYEETYGPVPEGLVIMHSCDNPLCVNPNHLYAGTQSENMQDCASKGRIFIKDQLGEKNSLARLTADKAREIRARWEQEDITMQDLADSYQVSRGAINNVVHNHTWKHV
jgi:hypothetical protein